jgi:chromosome partitioning protein
LANGLAASSLQGYDIVLIDCPPNLNIVTRTAIIASDYFLIPSRADYLSTLGIHYLIEKVQELVNEYNGYVRTSLPKRPGIAEVNPKVLGIVFTMIQIRNGMPIKTNQDFIIRTTKKLTGGLKVPAFSTATRFNQGLYADASSNGTPLAVARNVPAEVSAELNSLADEFLEKLNLKGNPNGK